MKGIKSNEISKLAITLNFYPFAYIKTDGDMNNLSLVFGLLVNHNFYQPCAVKLRPLGRRDKAQVVLKLTNQVFKSC